MKNSWPDKYPEYDGGAEPLKLSSDAAFRLLEDILNRGVSVRIRATGSSMAPFLMGGEILTIKRAACSELHKGDLILVKTPSGVPVIHRLVRRKSRSGCVSFQTKGDAQVGFDEPVFSKDILGKAYLIEKNTAGRPKQINLESPLWKKISYLAAMNSVVRSKARFAVLKLLGRRPFPVARP